jgi:hypothetical protein
MPDPEALAEFPTSLPFEVEANDEGSRDRREGLNRLTQILEVNVERSVVPSRIKSGLVDKQGLVKYLGGSAKRPVPKMIADKVPCDCSEPCLAVAR